MTDPQQLQRATESLRRAIASEPGDFEHPDHADLVVYAEGGLSDVDRELVASHLALCPQCADDVRDVQEISSGLILQKRTLGKRVPIYLSIGTAVAAGVALFVMLREAPAPTEETQPSSIQASTPASTPAPASVLSAAEQSRVDAAIAARRVDVPPRVRALAGSMGRLLGPDAVAPAMAPLSPAGTVVASATPAFSWQPLAGAVSYRVAVFDASFNEVASSGDLTITTWTPRAPLPANVPLAWQVTARLANGADVIAPAPPRPEARLMVLDVASSARISDLRARLADQPIALGILLANAGLIDDAAREFARAGADPAQSALASSLAASLRNSK